METENKERKKQPATYWIGEGGGWLLRHVVSGLAATGITPNMFTFLGSRRKFVGGGAFRRGTVSARLRPFFSSRDFSTWRTVRWPGAWDA